MSVRIRLSRVGKKHVPFYRIVVIDSRKKRDGACLADLGTYDALKSSIVRLDHAGIDHWLSVGAQPSQSVKKIVTEFKRAQSKATPVEKAPKAKKVAPKVQAAEPEEAVKSDS